MQRVEDGDDANDPGSSDRQGESLQFELAYSVMSLAKNGSVLTRGQKSSLRGKEGYCRTCEGVPVRLFSIRRNPMNPLRVTKEPLTVKGKCSNGVCFECYPEKDPKRSSRIPLSPSSAGGVTKKNKLSLPVGKSIPSSLSAPAYSGQSKSTLSRAMTRAIDGSGRSESAPAGQFDDSITQFSERQETVRTSDASEVSQLSTSFHSQSQRPLLKVFQASPLAYEDWSGTEHPVLCLDLEAESNTLRETLDGTGIDVVFETATTDNLGKFLSTGNRFLHFSCHGHPKYLFIENDHGGGQPLLVDENLKAWIKAGGNNLQFVFVSACHSRPAGDAFLEAGVQHVICSEQKEQTLNNMAAIVFARDFYRALANGRTLQQSYDLAIQAIKHSPDVPNPDLEAKKFVLLPEGKDHNIYLFYDKENPPPGGSSTMGQSLPSIDSGFVGRSPLKRSNNSRLPVPPQIYIGRERDMYRVTKALFVINARFVSLTGPAGIGKVTLAKAVAQYIEKRNMSRFEVLWMPPVGKGKEEIDSAWSNLFRVIQDSRDSTTILSDDTYLMASQDILDYLYDKKVLIIMNAAKTSNRNCIPKLSMFLDDLFERTKFAKVLLVHQEDASITSKNTTGFPCLQAKVALEPLDFTSTVALFGKTCPHACSKGKVWSPDILLKKRSDSAYKVLGEGFPTKTILAARKITETEYKKLVGETEEICLKDFESTVQEVESLSNRGNLHQPTTSRIARAHDTGEHERPPLRSQIEVLNRFGPLLRREGTIHRKFVTAYIRRAVKGEHIVTSIEGKPETEYTVENDDSWVVCGKAAGEYYVMPDKSFRNCYDSTSAKEIRPGTKNPTESRLRQQGFLEYKSKNKVWARQVDSQDMDWFRYGSPPSASGEAYFQAPWKESMRIEQGDYLVMPYPGGNEIYRIEYHVFGHSYINDDAPESNSLLTIFAVATSTIAVAGVAVLAALYLRG